MVSLIHSKLRLRIARAYFFDDAVDVLDTDVAFLFQSVRPLGRSRPFSTLHVDLTRETESLLLDCSKSNQYKIRRAQERDGLSFEMLTQPSSHEVLAFIDFYDRFAVGKGLPRCDSRLLWEIRSVDGLRISLASTESGEVLCRHVYVTDGRRCRLMHSASHFREVESSLERSLISRANRALHWFDIRRGKEDGLAIYDFGGYSENHTNPAVQRIHEFKSSFGGYPVVEYNCAKGFTALGRAALWGHRMLHKNELFG